MAIALCLTACGGGGDGGGNSGGGGGGSTPPPTSGTATSGKLVDGYLSGSTVFCDANKNGIADTSEAKSATDAGGNFRFASGCTETVVGGGGSDATTGYAFNGTLKAPVGSIVVTPLTTLLADSGMTLGQLCIALGLPAGTDVTQLDPADGQHQALLKTTLAVQQIVQQLANMFARLGGSTDIASVYAKVSAALSKSLLDHPGMVLISADGTVNVDAVNMAATGALIALQADARFASITISVADLIAAVAQISAQAQLFATALEADLAALLIRLQNPAGIPIETHGTVNYLALQNDSIRINGAPISYATLAAGATISSPTTIGLDFSVNGSPAIDTTASVALELEEVGGQSRVLQLLIDKVNIRNTGGQLSIAPDIAAKVFVYGHTGDGNDINLTLNDLSFKPLTVTNNSLVLNYKSMVDKVLASVDNTTRTTASKFTNITGAFNIKVVAGGLTVRNLDGASALPLSRIVIQNTARFVIGPGFSGRLTIQ